jgi:uncharacterized membrane protein
MNTVLNNKHYFYLLLAILGGGFTFYYAVLGTIEHHGNFDTIEFISSTWIDNYYAKSLTLDFWTGAIAGTFFIIMEGLRLKMKRIWLYLLLTVFVAFAFGFPLFLYLRELELRKQNV